MVGGAPEELLEGPHARRRALDELQQLRRPAVKVRDLEKQRFERVSVTRTHFNAIQNDLMVLLKLRDALLSCHNLLLFLLGLFLLGVYS